MEDYLTIQRSHVVARVREALAEDPRLNELDIQVTVAGGKVFLLGAVASEERKAAAEQVARDVLPEGVQVVNSLWVAKYEERSDMERLK